MLLADAAQESGGKLYVLGGGWSIVKRSGPMSMALAIKIEVPWTDANARHEIVAELLNEDGAQALSNGRPVRIEGALEVGRPAGIPAGTALDAPLALTVNGVELDAGGYRWQLAIDGVTVAEASFRVVGDA